MLSKRTLMFRVIDKKNTTWIHPDPPTVCIWCNNLWICETCVVSGGEAVSMRCGCTVPLSLCSSSLWLIFLSKLCNNKQMKQSRWPASCINVIWLTVIVFSFCFLSLLRHTFPSVFSLRSLSVFHLQHVMESSLRVIPDKWTENVCVSVCSIQ